MDNYENSQKESDARRDRVRKRHEEWDKKEEESKPKKQTPTKTKEKIEENFETNVKDLNKKFKLKIPISKVEHSILKKLILHKDTEERKKNNLIANSGFWLLTNRGKTIFTKAKQLIQQKEQESRKE